MNTRWIYHQVHGRMPARRSPKRSSGRGPARSPRYRAWIRTLPSLVSGRYGCEACHTKNNGMSSKGSCFTCVPLTRDEHLEYDANRAEFEREHGICMAEIVRGLNAAWFRARSEAA